MACVSREEGFGFTPLEALARGTPPMVADLPVFDETVGDAALRVPLGDAGRARERAAAARARARAARAAGPAGSEAVARLSWEDTARETRGPRSLEAAA